MSVLIKGMEMPEHCDECYIREKDNCPLTKTNVTGWGIPLNCPLVLVPPHGDLIDRDELRDNNNELFEINGVDGTILAMDVSIIDDAPTIIPASEEG